MKLCIVTVGEYSDYRVVGIFAASKAKDEAAVAAGLVGGRVETEAEWCGEGAPPWLFLNTGPADAANLPKGAKAFYWVRVERSGAAKIIQADPLLDCDGKLQKPAYDLDSYAIRVARGIRKRGRQAAVVLAANGSAVCRQRRNCNQCCPSHQGRGLCKEAARLGQVVAPVVVVELADRHG